MNISDTMLDIRTLGSFRISAKGKPVAVDWPDETQKVLFCTLLSPALPSAIFHHPLPAGKMPELPFSSLPSPH